MTPHVAVAGPPGKAARASTGGSGTPGRISRCAACLRFLLEIRAERPMLAGSTVFRLP